MPRRVVVTKTLELPGDPVYSEFMAGSGTQEASTTMAFAKLLRNLLRDKQLGDRIVPIIPDEARTFGMDPLFKEVGIYSALGQLYDPVDSNLVLCATARPRTARCWRRGSPRPVRRLRSRPRALPTRRTPNR